MHSFAHTDDKLNVPAINPTQNVLKDHQLNFDIQGELVVAIFPIF